jgi:hypothetical protein
MPASYRKAPRPLVLARAEHADESREQQPSDNDFTVLLQRDAPRFAVPPSRPRDVAPPSRPRDVAPPRDVAVPRARAERRIPQAPPAPPPLPATPPRVDADQTAPATVASIAPPPPTTVTVAPPAPLATPQPRRARQALVVGALAFLAFGGLSGIGVELALRGWGHSPSAPAAAEMVPATAVIPATPSTAPALAVNPLPTLLAAPTSLPAPLAVDATAFRWSPASSGVASVSAAPIEARPHHHRKHRHAHPHDAPAPAPVAAAPAPPAPPATPSVPVAPDPALADYPLPDPGVAAAPAPGAAPSDDMNAAQQMLTQAKAELSL